MWKAEDLVRICSFSFSFSLLARESAPVPGHCISTTDELAHESEGKEG